MKRIFVYDLRVYEIGSAGMAPHNFLIEGVLDDISNKKKALAGMRCSSQHTR
jgi:hypothetical protein